MKAFDDSLKQIFDEIDTWLEDKYGSEYPLHPNRPERDTTSNPEMDGLFNVGASFSAGYGSRKGRGYIVDIHMSTLGFVPPAVRDQIEQEVMDLLHEKLPQRFPGRDLKAEKDGPVIKIYGDLSLGEL
jgi:hypothetical protein